MPKTNPKPQQEKRKFYIRNEDQLPRVNVQTPAKLPRVKLTTLNTNLNHNTQLPANKTPHIIPFEPDKLPHSRTTRATSKLKRHLIQSINAVLDEESGKLLEYRHFIKDPKTRKTWLRSFANEIARLA